MKFIFFPNGWVLAHVARMIEVAKVLKSQGHQVLFAGEHKDPRSYLPTCLKEGFETIQCMEFRWPYIWDRYLKYRGLLVPWDLLTHQKFAPLDLILDAQVQLIEREKPDMVVCDGTFSLSNAAYITRTPMAGIMNAYYTHFYRPTSIFRPMMDLWDWVHLSRLRNRVYRKYGCKPVRAMALLKSVRLICPGLEEFDEYGRDYPNWEAVGPLWGKLSCDRPAWLDTLDGEQTNVYITMGSTGNLDGFLRKTYAALAKTPYRFVVTTGGQLSEETQAMAPPSFHFADYAPGDEILKHCSALIYHGGNGTMYQALAAGVPMLALPHTLEQDVNVRASLQCGFSKLLKPRRATGARVVQALEELIGNPAYAQAAQGYSEVLGKSNGIERAAEIILEVAREGAPPGL